MTFSRHLKIAGLAIAFYTGWNADSLFVAWRHSPFDQADGMAWVIWMIPVCMGLCGDSEARLLWLVGALGLTFLGSLLDLNLLRHLAFALACAGLTDLRRGFWIWLPTALAWMPVLGWFLSKENFDPFTTGCLRVILASGGTIGYFSLKK